MSLTSNKRILHLCGVLHIQSKTSAGIRIIPMLDKVFEAFWEEYQYQAVKSVQKRISNQFSDFRHFSCFLFCFRRICCIINVILGFSEGCHALRLS